MWLAGAVIVALVAIGVSAAIAIRRVEPFLRAQIVEALSRHFRARVELDSFHVSLVKGIEAEGKGLRIWPPSNTAGVDYAASETGDPLISLDDFRFHAPLHYRPGQPVVIRIVSLKGLKIDMPPRVRPEGAAQPAEEQAKNSDEQAKSAGEQVAKPEKSASLLLGKPQWMTFTLERIECTNAELTLETNKPGKLPLVFEIAQLTLTQISPDLAANYDAELTNPKPRGLIHAQGRVGPWQTSDPGESPLNGNYTFQHADLSVFTGIAGFLESVGRYEGTLRNMTVDGDANVPDFSLTSFGNAMPLRTHFHAKVDGTNGDTWLEPVDATLEHSHFTARGQVVRVGDEAGGKVEEHGRDISLKVDVDKARIEDFLILAGKSKTPLLNGDVKVKTTLHIAPGKEPVEKRLELDGEFHLAQASFTNEDVQNKIRTLSLRGLGKPGEIKKPDPDPVAIESKMDGKFKMEKNVVTLSQLQYSVPGVTVDLAGSFALEGGVVNFAGTAKTQATVSQMVGGWKGLLLKPADRFFKKDGAGAEVPIHIGGTREKPQFGVDFGKMKGSSPEKPGEKQQEQPPGEKPR